MPGYTDMLAILLAAACLAGCGRPPQSAREYAQGTPPRFEYGPCAFAAGNARVDCGTLIVPENRHLALTREVRVAVAILRGRNPAPDSTPALFLPGGPGEPCLAGLAEIASQARPVLAQRDLIVLDYRGVGASIPALDCEDPGHNPGDPRFLTRCRKRLVARGIDPGSYRTTDVAADIADLAGVLGYRKLALIGNSYGTRVAFAILRDHPGLAASAVLDAATPPEADLFESAPATSERAFAELQRACLEDPECAARHPDLGRMLDSVLARLAGAPPEILLHPGPRRAEKLRLTPAVFTGILTQCFAPPLLPVVPALLSSAEKGEYGPIAALLGHLASQPPGKRMMGTYEAVQCAEEMPFNSAADAQAVMRQHPRFAALSAYPQQAEHCAQWPSDPPPDPRDNRPVASPVPVLFLSGRFDPIVDPAWAEAARAALPHSRHVVFPNAAHGALHRECGWKLAADFLAHPDGELDACFSGQRPPRFLADVDSAGILRALQSRERDSLNPP
jgi:pimeloyl-ACP methyl ester carboxylesterase